jgi:hemolysin III
MEQDEAIERTSAPASASILSRRAVNGNNTLSAPTNATSNNANGGSVSNNNRNNIDQIESIIHEYTTACQIYGCADRINPGVLTTFRFQLPSLRVSGAFFDADMLALVEVLLNHVNGALSYIRRLDFSIAAKEGMSFGKKGIRSHGAYALSKVLQMSLYIEEVFLPKNRIGPYGASAIFCAAKENRALKTLLMRGCRIGERGAFALVSQILMNEDASKSGLREIDLSVNQIGFYGVYAIEKALKNRRERLKAQGLDDKDILVEIDLEGNMVFQEVMNCVTHGLGILLGTIGTSLLSSKVKGMERHYKVSCAVYSTSLVVLYLSSTLYHSFFALLRTRYIFQVFDKCAIYILIAGSYTPFLTIVLHHKPMWSGSLLAFIWTCALSGISVEAFLPLWKFKSTFSLAMYLGMGWSCVLCMHDFVEMLPANALYLIVAGGVAYTSGVPFFVRNNNLDHSIWHVFVIAGSLFHWLSVYLYVVEIQTGTKAQ